MSGWDGVTKALSIGWVRVRVKQRVRSGLEADTGWEAGYAQCVSNRWMWQLFTVAGAVPSGVWVKGDSRRAHVASWGSAAAVVRVRWNVSSYPRRGLSAADICKLVVGQ
jgi:hypothetical protein